MVHPFELCFLQGPRGPGSRARSSTIRTGSPMPHTVSLGPAAMAGVTRGVWWMHLDALLRDTQS